MSDWLPPNLGFSGRGGFRERWAGHSVQLILTLVGLLGGVILVWYAIAAILIGLGCPGSLLVIGLLGGWVWYKSRRGRIREERAMAGCCIHCGYDLRASPERCPECGEIVADESIRRKRIYDEIVKARKGKALNVEFNNRYAR